MARLRPLIHFRVFFASLRETTLVRSGHSSLSHNLYGKGFCGWV